MWKFDPTREIREDVSEEEIVAPKFNGLSRSIN
jgi:hypothetical protein